MQEMTVAGHRVCIWMHENAQTIVYVHTDREEAEKLFSALPPRTALVCTEVDWNRELSPWAAEKVFAKGEDFAGEADRYTEVLCGQIIPMVENGHSFSRRVLAGYSLAGLFAVYVALHSSLFSGIVSASGSLWFDGFTDYLRRTPLPELQAAYFSVGDKEKQTRNLRMARVEDCTRLTEQLFAQNGIRSIFRLNPGGHFAEPTARLLHGIRWVLENS